ncbi:hypothetical protein PoB_000915000 [Plakobranchus ocellatus]|uniref:Uncharacterized protein n=1 Tax=Plakobranchus ocellatus TaxID=259542 RepID=A0AAV3YJH2_9GAST|nr:hypothetical protein PoB_000915000 [Plakobranchus ocellatus]
MLYNDKILFFVRTFWTTSEFMVPVKDARVAMLNGQLTPCKRLSVQGHLSLHRVDNTVNSETALRSAGTLLSWVRVPSQAYLPGKRPESLRSPCFGLNIYPKSKPNQTNIFTSSIL